MFNYLSRSAHRHVDMLEVPRAVGHDAHISHTLHHKRLVYHLCVPITILLCIALRGSLGSIKIVFSTLESDKTLTVIICLSKRFDVVHARYGFFFVRSNAMEK